jgi:hypothetical protein
MLFLPTTNEAVASMLGQYVHDFLHRKMVAEAARPVDPTVPYTWDAKPKYKPLTCQQAIDAVVARARSAA